MCVQKRWSASEMWVRKITQIPRRRSLLENDNALFARLVFSTLFPMSVRFHYALDLLSNKLLSRDDFSSDQIHFRNYWLHWKNRSHILITFWLRNDINLKHILLWWVVVLVQNLTMTHASSASIIFQSDENAFRQRSSTRLKNHSKLPFLKFLGHDQKFHNCNCLEHCSLLAPVNHYWLTKHFLLVVLHLIT